MYLSDGRLLTKEESVRLARSDKEEAQKLIEAIVLKLRDAAGAPGYYRPKQSSRNSPQVLVFEDRQDMSFRYLRSKPDKSTQQIVDELRALGFHVEHVGQPVDLLVSHHSWPPNTWRLLECKTPHGKKGVVRLDKRQQKQQDFCAEHGIPYVLNGMEALTYLRENRP